MIRVIRRDGMGCGWFVLVRKRDMAHEERKGGRRRRKRKKERKREIHSGRPSQLDVEMQFCIQLRACPNFEAVMRQKDRNIHVEAMCSLLIYGV